MTTRRKYNIEFRFEALGLGNEPGVTLKQLGQEPGINPHLLGRWHKQLRVDSEVAAFPCKGEPRDEKVAALK